MTRLHYVAPSVLPSRSANSVHVVMQCDALTKIGADVTLYAKRAVPREQDLPKALADVYGVSLPSTRLVTYYSRSQRADNVKIAALALTRIHRGAWPDMILSRNLYAAYAIGVVERRPLLFETHQIEYGVRKWMQRSIMTRPWVTTVVISNRLADALAEHHGVHPKRFVVLHDAAPAGLVPLAAEEKRTVLGRHVPDAADERWKAICGYFGHLYEGRGIEIIEAVAAARPQILFLVAGGNEEDVRARRAACSLPNLRFLGHLPYPTTQQTMRAVDVLLMPYQSAVSIGVARHDTAGWMSPLKMFEYMASGVPLISSDLPALREILRHGENALLVPHADAAAWAGAVDQLAGDRKLAARIASNAHAQYASEHTWEHRARSLLTAVT